ncbi:Cytochrome P450 [Mycena venus]|uniref:Cytochrome P450 n=1 Tax=Mycena venus TaxID=2733690 RepID=A0A8H7CVW0_9AGAR|nr:Cytochrome P450 [Mycena venus]
MPCTPPDVSTQLSASSLSTAPRLPSSSVRFLLCSLVIRSPPALSLRSPFEMMFTGNSLDLYSGPHGLAYHHTLSATYVRAFKVRMIAGVRLPCPYSNMQEEKIYLSDTRALHHVLVRDTHVFDETTAMMACVPFRSHPSTTVRPPPVSASCARSSSRSPFIREL